MQNWLHLLRTVGVWQQSEASGCDTSCGVAAGSGTKGTVTCTKTTGCDESEKPAAKQCPATPACGTYSAYMMTRCMYLYMCMYVCQCIYLATSLYYV